MWISNFQELPQPQYNIQNWLLKPYVLSAALKRVCATLKVDVLNQVFEPAFEDEYSLIESPKMPFVRQVFLVADQQPMTYGRVVIPKSTYDHFLSDFDNLGTNLIGEKLLYNQNAQRSPFEYAYFDNTQPMTQSIFKHLHEQPLSPLWARRSVFRLQSFPLLVTDVILPWIPEYVEAPC